MAPEAQLKRKTGSNERVPVTRGPGMVLIRILDASIWSVGSAKDVPFGRLFAASGS
jgi:hypothetical protein